MRGLAFAVTFRCPVEPLRGLSDRLHSLKCLPAVVQLAPREVVMVDTGGGVWIDVPGDWEEILAPIRRLARHRPQVRIQSAWLLRSDDPKSPPILHVIVVG